MNAHHDLPILYSFRRCPYAMRARLALAYAKRPYIIREITLKNKPQQMLEISPKATVPVLKLADRVIDESWDIMLWCHQNSELWLEELQPQITALVKKNDQEFKPQLDRFKYPQRFNDSDSKLNQENCLLFFRYLDDLLRKHQYLVANHLSLADLAVMPFVRQASKVDECWFGQLQLDYLKPWLQNWLNSPEFKHIMHKFPVWRPDLPDQTIQPS